MWVFTWFLVNLGRSPLDTSGLSQGYMALIGELTGECYRRSYQGFFIGEMFPCVGGGGGWPPIVLPRTLEISRISFFLWAWWICPWKVAVLHSLLPNPDPS